MGSHGVIFLPNMGGSGCPIIDRAPAAPSTGSPVPPRGNVLRAWIEGQDFQLVYIVQETGDKDSSEMDMLSVMGEDVRSPYGMQKKAYTAGRPIETSEVENAGPLGVAMLAEITVGLYSDDGNAFAHV